MIYFGTRFDTACALNVTFQRITSRPYIRGSALQRVPDDVHDNALAPESEVFDALAVCVHRVFCVQSKELAAQVSKNCCA